MELRQRRKVVPKVCSGPVEIKGLNVVIIFTQSTGKVLPDRFWQFWNNWCTAQKNDDQVKMRELEAAAEPHLDQYIDWIEEVKAVVRQKS